MINADRIVPVQNIDLLSLYGLVIKQSISTLAKLEAVNPGEFAPESGAKLIAAEPVKTCDIQSGLTSTDIYFVAAYDYEGFSLAGTAVTPEAASDEVVADASTLYKATLAGGKITITKVGF